MRKLLLLTVLVFFAFGQNFSAETPKVFKVRVDCSQLLQDMIVAGNYDYVHSDFDYRLFPAPTTCRQASEIAIELVDFGKYTTYKKVLREFSKRGLRPATLEELLAFGAQYPDEQRGHPVVAVGSVSVGNRVPVLVSIALERWLHSEDVEYGWEETNRFAAVRK